MFFVIIGLDYVDKELILELFCEGNVVFFWWLYWCIILVFVECDLFNVWIVCVYYIDLRWFVVVWVKCDLFGVRWVGWRCINGWWIC